MLKYHFANLFAKVDSGNRISPTDLHCIDWRRASREVSRKEALLKLVRVWSGRSMCVARMWPAVTAWASEGQGKR